MTLSEQYAARRAAHMLATRYIREGMEREEGHHSIATGFELAKIRDAHLNAGALTDDVAGDYTEGKPQMGKCPDKDCPGPHVIPCNECGEHCERCGLSPYACACGTDQCTLAHAESHEDEPPKCTSEGGRHCWEVADAHAGNKGDPCCWCPAVRTRDTFEP